jgi:hypothetical protein
MWDIDFKIKQVEYILNNMSMELFERKLLEKDLEKYKKIKNSL